MRRENQIFIGEFKDKELYLFEDALNNYKNNLVCQENKSLSAKKIKEIDALIMKLYKVWEK